MTDSSSSAVNAVSDTLAASSLSAAQPAAASSQHLQDEESDFSDSDHFSSDLDDDDEDDEEEDDAPARCLFCSEVLPTLPEFHAHTTSAHGGFDFRVVARQMGLDFYQQLRLINFIRQAVSEGKKDQEISALLRGAQAKEAAELSFLVDPTSEAYFKPVLAEDSLLFSLPQQNEEGDDEDDEKEEQKESSATQTAAASSSSSSSSLPSIHSLLQENHELRNQLSSMAEAMQTMQAALKRLAFQEEEEEKMPALESSSVPAANTTAVVPATAAASSTPAPAAANPGSFAPEHIDRDYFGGYSGRNIHEIMLRDTVRTEAYRDFMYKNKHVFEGKVVLDVGCGTGILSMFAAKAGAKRVIGVDAADIVHSARAIIAANGLSDRIEVLHGKMEEVTLPVDKVDIIISEWMGYFLLFESMLPSVLYARDKYLRAPPSASQTPSEATGVYPDKSLMFIAAIETSESIQQRVGWWSNVYGFDMSSLVEEREKFPSTTVEIIRPHQVISSVAPLFSFDCNTVQDRELDFESEFELHAREDRLTHPLTGFMVYFDTNFELHCSTPISLSTAPEADRAPQPEITTHRQQSVFYIAKPIQLQKGDVVKAKMVAKRMKANPRAYHVLLEYQLVREGQSSVKMSQEYNVA